MNSHHRRQASFLKQALLIAAPLVILSAVSLYSLRQDKASIEQDARDRARILAPELARQWSTGVSRNLAQFLAAQSHDISKPEAVPQAGGPSPITARGRVTEETAELRMSLRGGWLQSQCLLINGQIRIPVDYPHQPEPPDWPNELKTEQSRLWRAAEEALFQRRDPKAARNAVTALIGAKVPAALFANAEFNLLLLEARQGAGANLAQRLADLAQRHPRVCTEAGSPLADLALIQALHQASKGRLPDDLMEGLSQRVIRHPSFLTPQLLEAARGIPSDLDKSQQARFLTRLWLAQERSRGLLHSLLHQPMDPTQKSEIWLDEEGQRFLALYSPTHPQPTVGLPSSGAATHVTLIPARRLEDAFRGALVEGSEQFPPYATPVIQLGDRRWPVNTWVPAQDNPGPTSAGELASASGQLTVYPVFPAWSQSTFQDILNIPIRPDTGDPAGRAGFLNLHPFTVSLELSDPDLLYKGYRQRLWLAAGLILSAAAAALIGLVSAWRAFQRQLRLAEMTSNFVSSVSHELRAPLASVRLMAESLDQGRIAGNERQKDYFRLIVQECRRLSSLVENVLDFSRINQGRKRYEFEPIDLVALIRQTVGLMEPNAGEQKVGLALSEPPPGAEEMQPCWDGQAVQQALVNLIDNAIKHSPAGGVVMVGLEVVKGAPESSVGHRPSTIIRVWVEDQGQGIPAQEQERIFEPFYRRGSELRRETKGVGIGLSIVKHIAEAHGGRVLVRSTAGQGSRFTLELPLENPTGTIENETADQRR
jgi:signal transduction histidine kinase